jgi:alpha-galactosidase
MSMQAQKLQLITVETDDLGLYLVVTPKGEVFQQYIGLKLGNPENILADCNNNNSNSKNVEGEAYSAFGNGNTNEVALKATHADGNMTTVLRYEKHETKKISENITLTEITLKDRFYPFYVHLKYKTYRKENVFECSANIFHRENQAVKLDGNASAYLVLKARKYFLTHFYGAWSAEMKMTEDELSNGIKIIDSKKGVRTTQSESPSFILSLNRPAGENQGDVIIGTLAWSGNYKTSFQVDDLNNLHILSGMNDFMSDYCLPPATDLELPPFIFTCSAEGVGEASRRFHRWARNYGIRDGNTLRPVILNSWEGAYFDFDETVLKNMIDDAARMGAEMFVLDDGWFGSKYPRDNDRAGLGDWEINYRKLPGGLQSLIDYAGQKDLQFGLWVEPEMVNPRSELAEKHPEWIVRGLHRDVMLWRNQLLLDMSNPEVQDFVYRAVSGILSEHPGIGYIKWDANRHVENFGSTYLDADKQSHFWIEYGKGLYKTCDRLMQAFPKVIFQACSSGGGRVDYGALKYHHEFWASDNTDARSRIFINWGFSQLFPAIATGSHVSQSPNHQTKHISPIKFRFDVAMAQRLGLELQPKLLTAPELEWTQRAVETYKRIRPVVQLGDLYRLISPYENDRAALMYVDADRSKAILFAYCFGYYIREDYPQIKLKGLDPDKKYRITEILPEIKAPGKNGKGGGEKWTFAGNGKIFTGDFLMKYGIRVKIRYTYESAVFELEEV